MLSSSTDRLQDALQLIPSCRGTRGQHYLIEVLLPYSVNTTVSQKMFEQASRSSRSEEGEWRKEEGGRFALQMNPSLMSLRRGGRPGAPKSVCCRENPV
ncbi:hypothetical protein CDAR_299921 [Caerostris darwini]|uniref:Uncharacterized protein n=1 Tax=Caerostris darwini TaxID=1538125 RepID=A0AAV4W3Y6_9ARAC|nr:hypothetical protein CDAR_299921 [Caerostris darwini]